MFILFFSWTYFGHWRRTAGDHEKKIEVLQCSRITFFFWERTCIICCTFWCSAVWFDAIDSLHRARLKINEHTNGQIQFSVGKEDSMLSNKLFSTNFIFSLQNVTKIVDMCFNPIFQVTLKNFANALSLL